MLKKLVITKKPAWNNIEPNFTRNRFDLSYPEKSFVLEYETENRKFFIPAHKKLLTLELGVYLTDMLESEFADLIKLCFQKFPYINRLKIASAKNNYYKNSLLSIENEYITHLPSNIDLFFNQLSPQTRYNLRRKQKNLEKHFQNIKIQKYTNDISDFILNKYFKYKKITHHKNYFLSVKEYIKRYHVTHAYTLSIEDKIEAVVLLSVINKNVYLENVTYNTLFSKYSIGILLIYEMIKDCIQNNMNCIYWGTTHEYKKHFATEILETYSGYIYKYKWQLQLKNLLKYGRLKK